MYTVPVFVLPDLATYTVHRNVLHFTILTVPVTYINHTITRRVISGIDQKIAFLYSCRTDDKVIFFLRRFLQFFISEIKRGGLEQMNIEVYVLQNLSLVSFKFALKLWSSDQKISVA
jgi:transcriptional regulatory protein LevR